MSLSTELGREAHSQLSGAGKSCFQLITAQGEEIQQVLWSLRAGNGDALPYAQQGSQFFVFPSRNGFCVCICIYTWINSMESYVESNCSAPCTFSLNVLWPVFHNQNIWKGLDLVVSRSTVSLTSSPLLDIPGVCRPLLEQCCSLQAHIS